MPYKRQFSSDAEILGMVLVGIEEAVSATSNDLKPLLAKYGFRNINPQRWYSVKDLVNFFEELDSMPSGVFDLAAVGKYVAMHLDIPSNVRTFDQYLQFSVPLYNQVHRGGDVGSLEYVRRGNTYHVTADVPYPPNYMYGLYFGLAQRFLDTGFTIDHQVLRNEQKLSIIGD